MTIKVRLYAAFLLTFAAWVMSFANTAQAHGIHIVAWRDGDQICTDSYINRSNRIRDGQVSMLNASGSTLDSGKTDDNGRFCFAFPSGGQELKFVILDGRGHRAEYILAASENASSPHTVDSAATESALTQNELQQDMAEPLRTVIRQELQTALTPVLQKLDADKQGPSLREIIGGIGWLIGIFALGTWNAARRAGKTP